MKRLRSSQRGDTLIEVLLSMAILSLIIVGGNAIMNFGMKNAITATEHTQVRNLIVGQAELLRYLRDNAEEGSNDRVTTAWEEVLDESLPNGNASPMQTCEPTRRAFYLTANYQGQNSLPDITVSRYDADAPRSNDIPYASPGEGLWIQGVKRESTDQNYADFHIRGCWKGAGSSVDQKVNTVLRLRTE